MTRITIDLDPAALRQLRESSQRSGRTMGAIASEALARALSDRRSAILQAFAWVDRDLGLPTVELDDTGAVRTILDRR